MLKKINSGVESAQINNIENSESKFKSGWENLAENPEFIKKFHAAMELYMVGGHEVGFAIFKKGEEFSFSNISEGTKLERISDSMQLAEVHMPWEEKPEGFTPYASFHTHPFGEPTINPSHDDLSSMVLTKQEDGLIAPRNQIMIIGQKLPDGKLSLLVVERASEYSTIIDAMYSGEPEHEKISETHRKNPTSNDLIEFNGRMYFKKEYILEDLENMGLAASIVEINLDELSG